jgi:hypothetical protein
VALLSLCWTALMRSYNEQQQQKQATPAAATRRQHRTTPTHKAISTRIEAAAADNEDAASASVGASSVPAIPVAMLRACAEVLLPAIGEEMQLRELLFSRSPDLMVAYPSSATTTTNRKRGGAPAGLHGATELPFSLPLRRKLPPRSYPELCPFCQNFAFFSAIYAPSVSSSTAAAASRKHGDDAEEAHVFLLCCTACLVKFLRAREDGLAAQASNNAGNKDASSSGSSSNKKRRINSGSSNASSSSSSSSTRGSSSSSSRRKPTATTWGEAGRLPSDEERLEQFVRSVGYSMRRHAGAWSRAYVGERCNNELLKNIHAYAQQILGGGETQEAGGNDNDDEESATSARASPSSSPTAASSKVASSSSAAVAAPAGVAGPGAGGIWARVSAMLHIGVVSDDDD